jgi:fructose-1-phosphate kinase PfkB-like protein
VKSTIGSGDSSVAGFCTALQRGYPMEDCLKLAMACGVCNAMFPQVGYIKKELVAELVKEIDLYPL